MTPWRSKKGKSVVIYSFTTHLLLALFLEYFPEFSPRKKSNGSSWAVPSTQRPPIQWPIQIQPGQLPISRTWCGPSVQTTLADAMDNLTHNNLTNSVKRSPDRLVERFDFTSPERVKIQSSRPQAATARTNRKGPN